MSLFSQAYVQALIAGGAVWYYTKNYRPSLLFDGAGTPKVQCLGPEALAALSAILVLGWHNGYFSMKSGPVVEGLGLGGASPAGAAPAELQAMAFNIAPKI